MARPNKDGVDYFPLNCVMDDKFRLLEAEYGIKAFAIVVKLYQKIFGEHGYYCEWNTEVELLFAAECRLGRNSVSEVVQSSIKRGIFSEEIYNKYSVLTSKGIQDRYLEIASRRKSLKLDERYLVAEPTQNSVNVDNNSVNVCNNPVNVDNNSQSKVNNTTTTTTYISGCACAHEDEDNEDNEDPTTEGTEEASPPTLSAVYSYFKDYGVPDSDVEAEKFRAYNAMRNWDILPSWEKAADLWIARIADKRDKFIM